MKTPKIFAAAVLGLASLAVTSCDDWLTIYPQNKLTDEQFWEDMNDLEGVRYAAYRNFASGDVVKKILAWGEFRSDNVNFSGYSSANDYNDLLRITDGRLDTASVFNDWAKFYTTINYCNQVLHNGERVLKADPQFSTSQWTRIKAEMIALRSLNYFYLVRAFGNVPYVNRVIKTDAEVAVHKQSLQSNILDSLINDVDAIKDDIAMSYSADGESTSLITRPFAYALLADLCMWRAAKYEGAARRGDIDFSAADSVYRRAYDYAVAARDKMDNPTEGRYVSIHNRNDRNEAHMGHYYLEQNYRDGFKDHPMMVAFTNLFEEGGSDEIIFEMPFNTKDNQSNTVVNSYFDQVTASNGKSFYSNYQGLLICSPVSFNAKNDCDLRLMYSAAFHSSDQILPGVDQTKMSFNGNGFVMKYQNMKNFSFEKSSSGSDILHYVEYEPKDYSNFIIYRKSDVLFIEAEAIAILRKLAAENGGKHGDMDLDEAKWIVEEHRRRSYATMYYQEPKKDELNTLVYMKDDASKWNTPDLVLGHVLDEKQLEFVGEGKRWFDIVRYMERMGATREAINTMFEGGMNPGSMYKETDRAPRYRSNLHSRWAFYNPVYYPEREASGWVLTQNPYWDEDPTNNDPESDEPINTGGSDDEPTVDNPDETTGGEESGEEPEPTEPTEE